MKNRPGEKIKLASLDELLGVVNEESAMEIEINKIHAFKNHPFKVLDDEKMSDIKNYHSEEHSLSNGQVLMRNYSFDEALVIVREMTDNLVLDLFEKGLVTNSLTLWIAYDHRYEHEASKGTVKLERESNSSKKIIDAVEDLYRRIADKYTGIRRIEVCANRVAPENYVQYSLFDDPKQTDKERHLQEAVLNVKQRYGKNAIMRGSNLLECSTYRERNEQIGGHRA